MNVIGTSRDKDGNLILIEVNPHNNFVRIQKPDLLWVSDWVWPYDLPRSEEQVAVQLALTTMLEAL